MRILRFSSNPRTTFLRLRFFVGYRRPVLAVVADRQTRMLTNSNTLLSITITINFDYVIGKSVIRRLCDDLRQFITRIATMYARNFRRTGLKVEMPSGLMLMVIVISC
jgi:hypothetical protein